MPENYVAPEFGKDAFNCPHCGAYAKQEWLAFKDFNQWRGFLQSLQGLPMVGQMGMGFPNNSLALMVENFVESPQIIERSELTGAQCSHCNKYSYWVDKKLIYPPACTAPVPADDMPEDCKQLYNEARDIADKSPRGAGALLRLCIEKLLPYLGGNKPKIADNIQALVAAGKITIEEQQYLDICRLIGNDAVHPREIALSDNREMVFPLFDFINILIQRTLTANKQRQSFIDKLPKNIQDKVKRES